jgi:rod shape-determining protein MreD
MNGPIHDVRPERMPIRFAATPIASVMLASAVPLLPFAADAPLLPPLGFLLFIAWRMLRSDLWPVWIGLPLGAWDDLVTGQPIGSAMALWTVVMLAMDALDRRVVWRDHWIDWAVGGAALLFVLIGGALLARAGNLVEVLALVGPQYLWSLFLLPAAMLIVGRLDHWRLLR